MKTTSNKKIMRKNNGKRGRETENYGFVHVCIVPRENEYENIKVFSRM